MNRTERVYYLLSELYEQNMNEESKDQNTPNGEYDIQEDKDKTIEMKVDKLNLNIHQEKNNILLKKNLEDEKYNGKYWPLTCLPYSYYMFKMKTNPRLFMYKASKAESMNILKISPRSLSKLLNNLDILLLQNVKPADLLTSQLMYLRNKNRGLINFISHLLKEDKYHIYFLKTLKYLLRIKNFNSAECIEKAFLRHKLDQSILNKLKKYSSIFKVNISYEKVIIPQFDTILKDLEDSNNNKNHTEASLKFCKVVELLVAIQNTKIKINKKKEHFLLYKIYEYLEEDVVCKSNISNDDYLFLYL